MFAKRKREILPYRGKKDCLAYYAQIITIMKYPEM
jgi:hypothetical protein